MKNGWTAVMLMEELGQVFVTQPIPELIVVQALLKMVGSYSTVALSPSRRDALTESPLRIVLFALRKMCDHAICRNFLRSSELLPVIVHLRQSPDPTISEYASAIASRACQA
jgi:fused